MIPEHEQMYFDYLRRAEMLDHIDTLIQRSNLSQASSALGLGWDADEQTIREAADSFRAFIDQLSDLRQARNVDGYWSVVRTWLNGEARWEVLQDYLARRAISHRSVELAEAGDEAALVAMWKVPVEGLGEAGAQYGAYLRRLATSVDCQDPCGYWSTVDHCLERSGLYVPEIGLDYYERHVASCVSCSDFRK